MFSLLLCVLIQTIFVWETRTEAFEDYIRNLEEVKKLEDAFTTYNVTEDILEYMPKKILKVLYNSPINPGDKVSPKNVISPPKVTFEQCNDGLQHILLLVDLDATDAEPGKGYLHWLCFVDCSFSCEMTIKEYAPPSPAAGGDHRFVFLLYQKLFYSFFDLFYVIRPEDVTRSNFSIKEFVDKHNCGHPLAANLMIASSG